MKIKSLKIDNFKTLVNFELIEPNSFSVFVGANGVGKSNIFEALEYFNFNTSSIDYYNDELFGGYKSFINFNNYNKHSVFYIESSNPISTIDYRRKPNEIIVENVAWERGMPGSKEDVLMKIFNDNFSRIFTNSKEANKLNLSSSDKKLNFNCDNLENVLKRILENPVKAIEIKEWLNLLRPGFSDI